MMRIGLHFVRRGRTRHSTKMPAITQFVPPSVTSPLHSAFIIMSTPADAIIATTAGRSDASTLASAAGGAAGSIASGLVSSGVAKLLTDKQMMTPFKEYLRQTAASATFSAANTGVSAVASGRKMTKEEIATELGMSFAFAMVDGYLSAMRSTKAASEQVKAKYDQITQEFDAIQNHMNGRQYATQEEYEQALRDLRTHVKELKAEVGSTYYAGQQEFVNDIQKGLDVAIGNINIMLAGDTGTAAAAAGTSGVGAQTVRLLTSEIEDAFRTGAGDTPNTPVTGGAPESTAVNDKAGRACFWTRAGFAGATFLLAGTETVSFVNAG